ncbi:pyridoxamine 5'-phosphate oxidase family protein [Pelagibius sp. Alg239-R121]|uniref:pyridoxamine 5'-phosphate oxidase family protein n=1 Tax=Pelagibius sp. Alg239-R121 TaxID=2993448 RepID=UPI0024A6B034|nr:pyridoxamine 5'-phosphate oxidase family protein [Pelagibius sp. Alg239-R121]
MAFQTNRLNKRFKKFIEKQKLFFVATAAPEGRVNLSPKGLDSLKIIDDNQIVWLSVTGSGNETAAHLLKTPRMTLMFCAFEGSALILRVFGTAEVIYPRHDEWERLYGLFPDYAGARNIFKLKIDLVTTSCGTGVPEMALVRTRAETELVPWYDEMGTDGVDAFWREKNVKSIDGEPTGIFE